MLSHGPSRFPLRISGSVPGGWSAVLESWKPQSAQTAGLHPKPLVIGLDAALDVGEIVLEGADLDGELVTEIVEGPLPLSKELVDFLSAGTCRAHGSVVLVTAGGCSAGPPSASHSRTGRPST